MCPVLFKLGVFTVYSYGFMLFVAVVVSLNLLLRYAKAKGYGANVITDLFMTILFSGIVGARILYVILNFDFYKNNPKEIFMLQHGGLAILGGIMAGILAAFLFCKRKKLSFWETIDLISPYVVLGHSIGRIGCFLNGCCYGLPSRYGIYFPVHAEKLIPTQLISSFLLFVLFIVLKIKQNKPHEKGAIFVSYVLYYSVIRFFVEFLRGDSQRLWLGLTIFQYICIGLFILSSFFYILLWKRKITK
ncbi:MAG: prolipoprotein diacylglyceryl transferase [Candidatus Omnitrophica bacterium]|nr:prolipoprotein diacylglyceryl transferase [Candidatus Omnitrophota bacterium]